MLVSPQALASGCKNPEAWKVLSLPPGGARPGLSSGRGPGSLQEDAVPLGPTAAHGPQEQSSHLSTRIAGTTSALRCARRVSWALPAARGLLQPVQQLWGSISRGHASNATISPQEHPADCAASTPGLRDGAEGPAVATALPPAAAFLRLRAALQRTLNHRSSPAEPRLLAGGIAAVPCLASLGGRTRGTHWVPVGFGSQTPDSIIKGLVVTWNSLGLGWRNLGGRGVGRDLTETSNWNGKWMKKHCSQIKNRTKGKEAQKVLQKYNQNSCRGEDAETQRHPVGSGRGSEDWKKNTGTRLHSSWGV